MSHSLVFRTRTRPGVLFVPLLLVFSAGCHHKDAEQPEASSVAVAPVATAVRAPLQNNLQVAGEFLPFQEVDLHAKVAGYIRRINVDIGDHVQAGQVLATLDVPELMAQVQGASAGVRQAQEQISRAKSDVLRAQANYEALHSGAQRLQQASNAQPGLIAAQELDDALGRDRAAAAQVDSAKSALSATQQGLGVSEADRQRVSSMADYSRIVAPFSGVITQRYADTGSLIQAGTSNAGSAPVVKLAQISMLRLRLPVPESLAGFVKDNQAATIRVGALGKSFTGNVTRNSASLDASTRTMQVEIDVPNPTGELTPGMYADVTLNVQRAGDSLVVPVQAVDRTGAPFVMLVDSSNHVQKRSVQVGITTPNRVEILSGLQSGDNVIVANLGTYQQGQAVQPKQSVMTNASTGGGDQ